MTARAGSSVDQSKTAACGVMSPRAHGDQSESAAGVVTSFESDSNQWKADFGPVCVTPVQKEDRGTLTAAGDVISDVTMPQSVDPDCLSFTERLLLRQLRSCSRSWSRQLQQLRENTEIRRSRLRRAELETETEAEAET